MTDCNLSAHQCIDRMRWIDEAVPAMQMERLRLYRRLYDEFGWTRERIAKTLALRADCDPYNLLALTLPEKMAHIRAFLDIHRHREE